MDISLLGHKNNNDNKQITLNCNVETCIFCNAAIKLCIVN